MATGKAVSITEGRVDEILAHIRGMMLNQPDLRVDVSRHFVDGPVQEGFATFSDAGTWTITITNGPQ